MELKKYQQYVFRKEWLEEFKWLSQSDDVSRVYCKICSCSITISHSGRHAILAHEAAKKHRKKLEAIYPNLKQMQDIKSQQPVLKCNQITQYPLQSSTPAISNYTTLNTRISTVPKMEYNRITEFLLQPSTPSTTAISNYATKGIRISKAPALEYNRTADFVLQSSTPSTTASSNCIRQDIEKSNAPALEFNQTAQFSSQTTSPTGTVALDDTENRLLITKPHNSPSSPIASTLCETKQVFNSIENSEKNEKFKLRDKYFDIDNVHVSKKMGNMENFHGKQLINKEYPNTDVNNAIEEIALYNKKENISPKKPTEKENSASNNSSINITNVYSGVDVENIHEKCIIKETCPNADMNNTSGEITVHHKKEKFNLENVLENNSSATCDSDIKTVNISSMDSKTKMSDEILRISPKDCMENSSREKHEKSISKTHQNLENCFSDNTLLVTEKPLHSKSLEIQDRKIDLHSKNFHSVSINETPEKITPKEIILKYNNGGKCSENAHNEEIQASATKVKSSRTNNSISENSPNSLLKVKNVENREIKSTTESSNPKNFQTERIKKISNSSKGLKGKKKVVISHEDHTSDSLNEDISKFKLNTSYDIQFPEQEISSNNFLNQNISIQDVSNSIQQNTQPPESSPQHAVLITLPGTKGTYNHFPTECAVNTIVQESSKTQPERIKNVNGNLNQIQSNPLSEQFSSDFFTGAHKSHKLIKSTKRNNNKNSKADELTKRYVPIQEMSEDNAYLEHLSGLHDCFMTSTHSQMNVYLLKKRRLRQSLKKSISKICSQKVLMKTITRKYKLSKTRPLQNTLHENWRKKHNRKKTFKKDNTHSSVNFSQTETNTSTHNAVTSLQNYDNFIHSSIINENVSVGVEHDSSNDLIDNEAFTSDSLSKGPHSSTLLPNNAITTERKTCNLISSMKYENLKKSLSQSSINSNSLALSQIFDSNGRDVKSETGNCIPSCSANPDHNPNAATSGVLLSRLPLTFCKDSSSFTSTNNYPFPSDKSIFNSSCFEKIRNVSTRLLERKREFEITCARELDELRTLIANAKLHSIDEFDFIDSIYHKYVSRGNQNELDGIKLLLAMGRNNIDFSESDNVFDAEKFSGDESKQIKGHQSSVPSCDIQHNSADHSDTVSSRSSVNFVKNKGVRLKNCKKRHVEPTNDELSRNKQAKNVVRM